MGRLSVSAGIAIERQGDTTKFLTTSALIKPLYNKIECPDDLKVSATNCNFIVLNCLK